MNIFALDASSKITSLAFQCINEKEDSLNLNAQYESSPENLSHSEEISSRFKELIKKANFSIKDLDLILVGSGPGSYTGLRISYAFVKGMACSLNIPVLAISPFLAVAYFESCNVNNSTKIQVTADARRKELFVATFDKKDDFSNNPNIETLEYNEFIDKQEENSVHITFSPELFSKLEGVRYIAPKLIYFYANYFDKTQHFSLSDISEMTPNYIRGLQAKTIEERCLEKR